MRPGAVTATLGAVDLYKTAREFPGRLRGRGTVTTTARSGLSRTALCWRTDNGRLVRVFRGGYVEAAAPDLLDRIRAALHVCPPGSAAGFHTAAALLGFGVPEDEDIHIVVPAGGPVPRRQGIRCHESALPIRAVTWATVPCTRPARTAIDLVRTLPDRPSALAVLDAALFARACTAKDLAMELGRHECLRGVRRARELVPLADGRAECRQESHLRLMLHDAGLHSFEPQVEVFDPQHSARYPRYRLDLADRARRVAVEYDGRSHLDGVSNDRRRHNWLDRHGWTMCYLTWDYLYRTPDEIVPMVLGAIARARQVHASRGFVGWFDLHPRDQVHDRGDHACRLAGCGCCRGSMRGGWRCGRSGSPRPGPPTWLSSSST